MPFRMSVKVNRLEVGDDGMAHEECWFCGRPVEFTVRDPAAGDAATMTVSPLGGGESLQGYCHRDCAERAKGALGF
jgi:hypothetical protein